MRLSLQEDFSSARKIHKKKSDSRGVNIVTRLQELDQDPSKSMRSLARELDISKFVVRKKNGAGHPLQVLCFEKGPVYEPGDKGE
jgi:hypothetical protein